MYGFIRNIADPTCREYIKLSGVKDKQFPKIWSFYNQKNLYNTYHYSLRIQYIMYVDIHYTERYI
jgi:hypothetical protein